MPSLINCPSCHRQLQVPDQFIGQKVQCPGCGTMFLTVVSTQPVSPPAATEGEPPPVAPSSASGTEGSHEVFSIGPPLRPKSGVADSAESPPGSLTGRVLPPAMGLLVVGLLGFFFSLFLLAIAPKAANAPNPMPGMIPDENWDQMQELERGPVGKAIRGLFALISLLIMAAGMQMMRLKSWGLAVTGSILAMVNFQGACCCLGLPVGVWALIVLTQPVVRSAFAAQSAE